MAKRERVNQRLRTRKELLLAAQRLLKEGRAPNIAEVAEAALVSRATAYRYFPTVGALLAEAPLDAAVPSAQAIFEDDPSPDPAERVDRAEAALHDVIYRNEAQLRLWLANSLMRKPGAPGGTPAEPRRQNRRTELITAALAPSRGSFDRAAYRRLCAALALIFGTEGMIVCQDVLRIDRVEARKVKSWAVRALVKTALNESKRGGNAFHPGMRARNPTGPRSEDKRRRLSAMVKSVKKNCDRCFPHAPARIRT